MKVKVAARAAEAMRELAPQTKRRLKSAILDLPEDPQGHKGLLEVKRLRSPNVEATFYRLRVGDWRAVYRIKGRVIEVIRVFHRREGYGWMERMGY